MRSIALSILMSFVALGAAWSQGAGNGVVKGYLRTLDTGEPMSFAAVMLQNPKDSTVAYSAISNDKGFFQINGVSDGEYRFVATFLGYKEVEKTVSVSRGARTKDMGIMDMEEQEILLGQVTVREDRIPVTVKQDTIEFDAASYKLRDNAVVEDLLKRLPGVEVGPDGSIRAMGEQISEITVDGQPFFGDDPKLATRNLPADIVSKVQVLERKSDQAQFTGIDDGNTRKSINITLKKDKNEGVFGRATLGGGNPDGRFAANGNVNRFRGKERVSLLGSGNNVNDLGFSVSDLMTSFGGGQGGRGGGMGDLFGGGGQGGNIFRGGQAGVSNMLLGGGSNAGITTAYAGGLNYRNEWSGGKLKFNSSYFGSDASTVNTEERLRQTLLEEGGGFSNLQIGDSENRRGNHRINMNLEYQIDSLRSLIFRPNFTFSKQNSLSTNDYTSITDENALLNSGNILSRSDNTRPALGGSLLLRQRFRKAGRTFSLNLSGSYNDQDTEQLNQSDNNFLNNDGILIADSIRQLSFQQSVNQRFGARLAYTEPLSRNKFLEINYDFNTNFQNSDRETFDFDPLTGRFDRLNDLFSNQFENTFNTHQGGFNYRVQKLKYDYTVGMSVQESRISSESPEQVVPISYSFVNLFPVAQFNYNFSQSKRLRINYRGNARNPSVNQLQPIPDVSNPQIIRTGNPELNPEISHNLNLNFNNFNMASLRSFFVSVRGTITNDRIVNATMMGQGGRQTIIPVNTDGAWNLNSFAAMGVPIKSIKSNLNLNTNIGYDHYANLFNGLENITNSLTAGGGFRLSFNPDEKFDLSAGANMSYNNAKQSVQTHLNSEFFNYTASGDFNWTLPLEFVIGSDVRFTANRGGSDTYNQQAVLLGAYVEKRFLKGNAGALRFQGFDLLNQNINVNRTVGDAFIEDLRTSILQRYFMLSFSYRFGKFGGQQMPAGMMRMMRF